MMFRDRVWTHWTSTDMLYLSSYLDGVDRKMVEVFASTRDFERTAKTLGRSSVSNVRANIKNALGRALALCSTCVHEVVNGPDWPYDNLGLRGIADKRKNISRQIKLDISVAKGDVVRANRELDRAVKNYTKLLKRYGRI